MRFDADKFVLGGETRAAILETAASLIKLDIAGIEALHDSTRRRLLTRGTHRPAEYLEEVHAEFVLDRIRRRGKPWSAAPIGKHGAPVAEQKGRGCAKYLFQMRNPLECMHSAGAKRPNSTELRAQSLALSEKERSSLRRQGNAAREGKQAGATGLTFDSQT